MAKEEQGLIFSTFFLLLFIFIYFLFSIHFLILTFFSCHGVIANNPYLGEDFFQQSLELFQTYYPIEIATGISKEEKSIKMVEWWSRAHELMIKHGLREDDLKMLVETANIDLREHGSEFINLLHEQEVPLLIFSAGISNVLEKFLQKKDIYHSNIQVFSNTMTFQNGTLNGFAGDLIHSLNKNAFSVKNNTQRKEERKYLLLLGDNPSDIHMSDGIDFSEQISIGFLNDSIQERLELYTQIFDVVLLDDSPMDFVLDLTKEILNHPKTIEQESPLVE